MQAGVLGNIVTSVLLYRIIHSMHMLLTYILKPQRTIQSHQLKKTAPSPGGAVGCKGITG